MCRRDKTAALPGFAWKRLSLPLLIVALTVRASADIGPNAKLRLEPQNESPAVSGQAYEGQIIFDAGRPGTVTALTITGRGWSVESMTFAPIQLQAGSSASFSFTATPADPDSPLRVSAQFGDQTVVRSFRVGPEAYRVRERGRPLVRLGPSDAPSDGTPVIIGPQGPTPREGRWYTFRARLVVTRPDGEIVGADGITCRVMDNDLIGSEVISQGRTSRTGYYNVLTYWDDGGDAPDLYVEFECDTPVVAVQDSSILETDYSWNTQDNVVEDFQGDSYDFGTLTPADPAEYPAVHIHSTIVRAHRYIDEVSVDLERVEVQWPEDGEVSYYNPFFEEIHIAGADGWEEATAVHEYGHHFMENHAANPSPDYCNGICDPGGDCGHCFWCPENGTAPFTEGWPDWLSDAVVREFESRYELPPLLAYNFEATMSCGAASDNPMQTEGFVAALLRDMEDDMEDQDGDGVPDVQPACARDDLNLHPAYIFTIMTTYQPTTLAEFITAFRAHFPLFQGEFWRTCANIDSSFTWPESEPPGVVAQLDSPTHPLGVGGNWPEITFEWEPAPDDASGVTAYSIVFGPAPTEPDLTAELTNGETTWQGPAVGFGQYFLSMKARDCVGNWSEQWTFFGPFLVRECNGNGIIDACETIAGCALFPALCGAADCNLSADCNDNGNPDDCDIAAGTSLDCNVNGIPDECESVDYLEWLGCGVDGQGNPLCTWHQSNWEGGMLPGPTDSVCIADNEDAPDLTFNASSGSQSVLSIGTSEVFRITGGTLDVLQGAGFHNRLEMTGGTLNVGGESRMTQLFRWQGGTLSGLGGTTRAFGPVEFPGSSAKYVMRDMVLSGGATWAGSGQILVGDGVSLTNALGSTFLQTNDGLLNRIGAVRGVFDNFGTYRKQGGTGMARSVITFNNHGTVLIEDGILSLDFGGAASGLFSGPATLRFGGGTYEIGAESDVLTTNVEIAGGVVDVQGLFGNNALSVGNGTVDFHNGVQTQVLASLIQTNGTTTGTDSVRVTGATDWRGGSISGTGLYEANGALTLNTGGTKVLGRDMIGRAGTLWQDTGQFWIGNGATFTNPASTLFESRTDASMSWAVPPRGTLQNDGEFWKSAGSGVQRCLVRFNNDGIVRVDSGTLSLDYGGAHSGDFVGSGTIRFGGDLHVLAASSDVTARALAFAGGQTDLHGSVAVPMAGVTACSGGTATFLTDAVVTSIGAALEVSNGTINFSSGEPIAATTLTITGGTITGTDELTFATADWAAGGAIAGGPGVSVTVDQTLTLRGSGTKVLGRDAVNRNAATWTDSGQFWIQAGGTFQNEVGATFESRTDASISWGTPPRGVFQNDGTFRKTAGTGSQTIFVPFNNTGSMEIQTGELALAAGGTHTGSFFGLGALTFSAGTHTLEPTGTIGVRQFGTTGSSTSDVHGTIDVAERIAIAGGTTTLHPDSVITDPGQDWSILQGGTLDCSSGTPILTVQTLTMSGGTLTGVNAIVSESLFDWSGGMLQTPVQFSGDYFANGVMNVHGVATKILNKRLELRGTGTWSGTGQLWIGAGAILRIMPSSTFDIQTDASISYATAPRGEIENFGTLQKTGGTGSQNVYVSISNSGEGSVELRSGTLTMAAPAVYRQVSSGATILNGGTLATSSPAVNPIQLENGSLTGTGAIGGRVSNSGGVIRPGLSGVGVLSITENYTQGPGARLSIELSGSTPGSEHDQLVVGGSATLDGRLKLRLTNGFQPQVGQSFTVLAAGAVSGQFATLDAPVLSDAHFEIVSTQTNVTVSVVAGGGGIPGDLNDDCQVGIADLAILLGHFGAMNAGREDGDIDGDDDVDLQDLAMLLSVFGTICP